MAKKPGTRSTFTLLQRDIEHLAIIRKCHPALMKDAHQIRAAIEHFAKCSIDQNDEIQRLGKWLRARIQEGDTILLRKKDGTVREIELV